MWIAVHDTVRLAVVAVDPADLSPVDVELRPVAGVVAACRQQAAHGGLEQRAAGPSAHHDAVELLRRVDGVGHRRHSTVHVRAAPVPQQSVVVGERVA